MKKECPLCSESMRLTDRVIVQHIPGTSEGRTHEFREWVCPECDYFEEATEKSITEQGGPPKGGS